MLQRSKLSVEVKFLRLYEKRVTSIEVMTHRLGETRLVRAKDRVQIACMRRNLLQARPIGPSLSSESKEMKHEQELG